MPLSQFSCWDNFPVTFTASPLQPEITMLHARPNSDVPVADPAASNDRRCQRALTAAPRYAQHSLQVRPGLLSQFQPQRVKKTGKARWEGSTGRRRERPEGGPCPRCAHARRSGKMAAAALCWALRAARQVRLTPSPPFFLFCFPASLWDPVCPGEASGSGQGRCGQCLTAAGSALSPWPGNIAGPVLCSVRCSLGLFVSLCEENLQTLYMAFRVIY